MIRALAYTLMFTLFITCALVSQATGEGGLHEFGIDAPSSLPGYVAFVPELLVDFVQFLVSCVSWEFAPDMPTDLRIALIAASSIPIGAVIIMDILPPLATAVGKIIDAFLPG